MANATGDVPLRSFFSCSSDPKGLQIYILSSVNVLIAITSFPGNLLIIVVLRRITSIHPPSKLLYSSLASTDLCVGIILQPLSIVYLLSLEVSDLCSHIGSTFSTVTLALCGVSLLTSTAISFDRFLALKLGIRYRHYITKELIWAFVFISWLVSCGNAVIYLYKSDVFAYTTTVAVFLCVSTSVFSYINIYRVLRHHQTQVQQLHLQQPNRRVIPIKIARYRKTVSSALWVTAVLVACYLPFVVIIFTAYSSSIHSPVLAIAADLAITLVQLNSSLNPLLYCWKIKEVRRTAINSLKQFLCC